MKRRHKKLISCGVFSVVILSIVWLNMFFQGYITDLEGMSWISFDLGIIAGVLFLCAATLLSEAFPLKKKVV